MTRLRHLGRTHALLAGLLLACALVLRLALPAGIMPVVAEGRIVLALCNDASPDSRAQHVTVEIPMKQAPDDAGKAPCAFAILSAPALIGGEPAALIVPTLSFAQFALPPPATFAPLRPAFLTPPLRGPPLPA